MEIGTHYVREDEEGWREGGAKEALQKGREISQTSAVRFDEITLALQRAAGRIILNIERGRMKALSSILGRRACKHTLLWGTQGIDLRNGGEGI